MQNEDENQTQAVFIRKAYELVIKQKYTYSVESYHRPHSRKVRGMLVTIFTLSRVLV